MTMLVPELIVIGVPGTDGSTIIIIVAPEPTPDGLDVP